jgi:hypothetical protein
MERHRSLTIVLHYLHAFHTKPITLQTKMKKKKISLFKNKLFSFDKFLIIRIEDPLPWRIPMYVKA